MDGYGAVSAREGLDISYQGGIVGVRVNAMQWEELSGV